MRLVKFLHAGSAVAPTFAKNVLLVPISTCMRMGFLLPVWPFALQAPSLPPSKMYAFLAWKTARNVTQLLNACSVLKTHT